MKFIMDKIRNFVAPSGKNPADARPAARARKHACENSVKYIDPGLCTGCGSCFNACPHTAISLEENRDGFYAPLVNPDACVNCGLCEKHCPIGKLSLDNLLEPECHGLYIGDDQVRKQSSSGGFFSALAAYVRERGGYVCGAAFDEHLVLRHRIISPDEELEPLRGSKYLQSHMGLCMREAKKLLEAGQWLLFSGTPCQIAGLNRFLDKKYEKLITAEVMCHGGSSPGAFRKYIAERFGQEEIKDYFFRKKDLLNWGHSEILRCGDGKILARLKNESEYFKMFNMCISTRRSCGVCQAASLPRQADFTLADAWGINHVDSSLNDGHGTSLIALNNQKAKGIFESLRQDFARLDKLPLDWVLNNGQPFSHPYKPTPFFHDRFFELLESNSFRRAVDYTLEGKFDVALMGVWYSGNYGSILTYFSLYSYLKSQGLLVLMVDKPLLVENDFEHKPDYHARRFAQKHYGDRISRARRPESLWELNRYADTFILGSDQMFHYRQIKNFKNTMLMNFVEDSKKKISYSTSFGHSTDFAPSESRPEIRRLLKRFDYLGVREETGNRILRDNYGIYDSKHVVDAIFLNNAAFYLKLAAESRVQRKEPFFVAYILDPGPEIREMLEHLRDKLNLELVILLDGHRPDFKANEEKMGLKAEPDVEAAEWLYYMANSEFVITDSYHGACFSILFNRNFVALANAKRGVARFESILGMSGLKNRLLMSPEKDVALAMLGETIDYAPVNRRMADIIAESKQWLRHALFAPKYIRNDARWDLLAENTQERSLSQENYICLPGEGPHLQFCTDLKAYLDMLLEKKEELLIFLAVKDTPGHEMTPEILNRLYSLGITTDLYQKLWLSFLAIINAGNLVVEDSKSEEPVSYAGLVEGKKVVMDSAPYKNGNIANIIIDNYNYSLNRRGLNFVIMDKKSGKVIDIVSFDTHAPQLFCHRVY